MRAFSRFAGAALLAAFLLPACGFAPDVAQAPTTAVIVTAAASYRPEAAITGGERFPAGAQLLSLKNGHAEPLLKDFAASADANLSFDGARVLFAGKKATHDPWQIWELTLATGATRKLVSSADDLVRPFHLPGGRILYAHHTAHGFQLEVAGADTAPHNAPIADTVAEKTDVISYLPASAFPDDVLADGRVLFETSFPMGTQSTPELMLVYTDGSGVESYRCDHGQPRFAGHQLASGDVLFTHGNSLGRFRSATATEEPVKAPRADYAGSIAETAKGDLLVSARTAGATHFALKLWHPGAQALQTLLARPDADLVEPVIVAERNRPNQHPSALHPWDYANLLVLDSRISREGDLAQLPAVVRLESLDEKGNVQQNGTAPVETDGSFFIKVPGNRPIRMSLLDEKGNVLRQEKGWRWIRSGEQRICVGCHTGPERSSENRVPAVLLRSTTPADLTASHPTQGGN